MSFAKHLDSKVGIGINKSIRVNFIYYELIDMIGMLERGHNNGS